MDDYQFKLEMEVRDYEIDMHGHVNNAIYLSYLEYCRAKFAIQNGIDIQKCRNRGYHFILKKSIANYKARLFVQDEFYVTCSVSFEGHFSIKFKHAIIRKSDNKLILDAEAIFHCLDAVRGKPCILPELKKVIESTQEKDTSKFIFCDDSQP